MSEAARAVPSAVCAAFDRVLISVDEADGVRHLDGIPIYAAEQIRALSLNRLDTMDDSIPDFAARHATATGEYCLYRCPSLPGMDRHLSASARTVSTTNLETDLESLSPRVSTTTLSQDLDRERFGLFLSSMPFLARSTSARTIEGLPPEAPQLAANKTTDLLATPHVTPHVTVKRRKSCVRIVYRSTSCPSLADGGRCHASAAAWVYRRRPVHRSQSPREDVNLEGEEIKDLPIEPRRNFPEFSPELLLPEGVGPAPNFSSAQQYRPSSAYGDPGVTLSIDPGTPRLGGAEASARHPAAGAVRNYFDVGDVPSSFSRPILIDERYAKQQRAPRLVQIKCLQWLNSLDSNR